MQQYEHILSALQQHAGQYAIKIALAALIFFIGKWLARVITRAVVALMKRSDVDIELQGFFDSLLYWGLFVVVCIAALGQLGIQTASFVAILGAAGLAVGLALQGSLSNFAAGVLLIIFRPFKVDDFVEIAGEGGKVFAIQIFTTKLKTPDNKLVIIPNARVLNSNIINYSATGKRRVDMIFGIGYDDDIDQARNIIREITEADKRILATPETQILLIELANNSVNLAVRPWVKSADYWDVYTDLNELVKKKFDQEGISIPFPQRTVHVIKQSDDNDS